MKTLEEASKDYIKSLNSSDAIIGKLAFISGGKYVLEIIEGLSKDYHESLPEILKNVIKKLMDEKMGITKRRPLDDNW